MRLFEIICWFLLCTPPLLHSSRQHLQTDTGRRVDMVPSSKVTDINTSPLPIIRSLDYIVYLTHLVILRTFTALKAAVILRQIDILIAVGMQFFSFLCKIIMGFIWRKIVVVLLTSTYHDSTNVDVEKQQKWIFCLTWSDKVTLMAAMDMTAQSNKHPRVK